MSYQEYLEKKQAVSTYQQQQQRYRTRNRGRERVVYAEEPPTQQEVAQEQTTQIQQNENKQVALLNQQNKPTTIQADTYINQQEQRLNNAQQNVDLYKKQVVMPTPFQLTRIDIAQKNITEGKQSLNIFKEQLPYPQYTKLSVDEKGTASVKEFEYTRWAKEVYGSPGYVQPGAAHVPYEKELGYANAIIQGAFDPEFWQEQIFGQHKGVDVVNKHLYESQNLRNIGYNERLKTFDSGKALGYVASRPLISNVIIPVATGYGIGAGLGALTKASAFAGALGKTAVTGAGAYYVGQATIPTAITGFKTGAWSGFQRNVIGLGIQTPGMMVGFAGGYNAIGKVNIPRLTTRGDATLDKFNANIMIPTKTFINRYNPRNIWVRWGATKQAPEMEISQSVLEGRTRFPTSPDVKTTLRLFEKGYSPETGLYETVHARAYPMKGNKITTNPPTRPSDVYGLYVSSKGEASPYFLRLGSKVPDYGYTPMEISILPKKPTFRKMFVESIGEAPRNVRYDIGKFKDWQLGMKPSSTATITPAHELGLKGEIEAVIPPGAEYQNIMKPGGLLQKIKGYNEYTTFMGREIPIYKYRVTGEGKGELKLNDILRQENETYGYYHGGKSIYSPTMISITGISSIPRQSSKNIVSSVISSNPLSSLIPSRQTSRIKSYVPSVTPPSYTPRSFTPKSYTPHSYTPKSYTPTSYKPRSYTPPSYTPDTYYPPGIDLSFSYESIKKKRKPKVYGSILRLRELQVPTMGDLFGWRKK